MILFTIGHSTRPIDVFLNMLNAFQIETLVDVRAIPASRFNTQFNARNLEQSLKTQSIVYVAMKGLGGRRAENQDSLNTGLERGFRGFADYMQTGFFDEELDRLMSLSKQSRICIMCAEAKPADCHRSLIADALTVRGFLVEHILGGGNAVEHQLSPKADARGGKLFYPPAEPELKLFAHK
ncbi:MAG: DUF488 domain-containing protein [Pseudomonadota bacterium]